MVSVASIFTTAEIENLLKKDKDGRYTMIAPGTTKPVFHTTNSEYFQLIFRYYGEKKFIQENSTFVYIDLGKNQFGPDPEHVRIESTIKPVHDAFSRDKITWLIDRDDKQQRKVGMMIPPFIHHAIYLDIKRAESCLAR